ncbi:jg25442, partial [Pararge aegeria aegeria]
KVNHPVRQLKTKAKVYETAVRPALLYGAECWATKRTHEQKLHVNEMKMLRWAPGVTRLDKVRNEYIRGSYKVAHITDKMTEGRLRWYGRGDDHAVRKALALPEHKRKRGRPASTWWTTVAKDIKNANLIDVTTQDGES